MQKLEKMADFFAARVSMYDEHMLEDVGGCKEGYVLMSDFVPENTTKLLDLGCGSGCVGIAIGAMRDGARGVLADISDKALAVAKENVYNEKLSSRLLCVQADMTKEPPQNIGSFDVIVSNPPYITDAEMTELDKSVREFEPYSALCGGEDGLDFYRAICENWLGVLKEGGVLAFECGINQSLSLDFDFNASRNLKICQSLYGLRCRSDDINESLVSSLFKLFTAVLILMNSAKDCNYFLFCGKRDGT